MPPNPNRPPFAVVHALYRAHLAKSRIPRPHSPTPTLLLFDTFAAVALGALAHVAFDNDLVDFLFVLLSLALCAAAFWALYRRAWDDFDHFNNLHKGVTPDRVALLTSRLRLLDGYAEPDIWDVRADSEQALRALVDPRPWWVFYYCSAARRGLEDELVDLRALLFHCWKASKGASPKASTSSRGQVN